MKKHYFAPVAELTELSSADVITLSLTLSVSGILDSFSGGVDADTLDWQ